MISERLVIGEGSEYSLNGMLTLPEEVEGPFPAAVLVHGSGPADMDGTTVKLTPLRDIAEGLARHGIAALRYDKRTFVYPEKMSGMDLTVREETIEDALRAIEILKSDPRIDRDRVFIVGHSMGGMLAPRIDAEGGDVRGMVIMAGSPYRLEEIVVRQMEQNASRSGVMQRMMLQMQNNMYINRFRGLYQMSDEEAKSRTFDGSLNLYYFKEMGRKTTVDYLKESEKPVLIMQGEADFQVLAKDDYARFKVMLAGRPGTLFRLYRGLDHCFVPAITDDIRKAQVEYGTRRPVDESVISGISVFIKEA